AARGAWTRCGSETGSPSSHRANLVKSGRTANNSCSRRYCALVGPVGRMTFPKIPVLPPRLVAIAVLLFAMICFQTGASLAKQMFALFGAQGMAALRLLFS